MEPVALQVCALAFLTKKHVRSIIKIVKVFFIVLFINFPTLTAFRITPPTIALSGQAPLEDTCMGQVCFYRVWFIFKFVVLDALLMTKTI